MNFYKDKDGNVYSYTEEQITKDLIIDKTKMTDEEVELHLNPPVSPDMLKKQQIERLQRIYTKQSIRITAIQIDKEFSNDNEYIQAQLKNYEIRYNVAKYTLNTRNATKEDKALANAVIQASEASTMFVAYVRTVLDVIRSNLTDAINSGADVNAKLDVLDNLKLTRDNITKEKIDSFLASFNG